MTVYEAIARETENGCEFKFDEPMKRHTTFGIGGAVGIMLLPADMGQAARLPAVCYRLGVPWMALGNGSNLLVGDNGWQGAVIKLKTSCQAINIDNNYVTADAGAMLSRAASAAAAAGLDGMAFAHGIPGTVGGAVMMNAGAYGSCMSDIVKTVTAADESGKVFTLTNYECDFGYRHSVFSGKSWLILSVGIQLTACKSETILARMEDLAARRQASQPLEYPSAGSFFKRPANHYAAALIEECGLKGRRAGGAQVSEKHAGFIINTGNASCADVLSLAGAVQDSVREMKGVELEMEVKRVGC